MIARQCAFSGFASAQNGVKTKDLKKSCKKEEKD
jgi:hypothetical protein